LRRLGHDVTVASAGSGWMNTRRDIDISRRLPGKAGGLWLWLRMLQLLESRLSRFDIVSLSSTGFVELKPERVALLFERIKKNNHRVFMTLLGNDTFYVDECIKPDGVLRLSEWSINHQPSPLTLAHPERISAWRAPELRQLANYIYDNVSGVTPVLYEYDAVARTHIPAEKIGYIGIPIDTMTVTPVNLPAKIKRVNLFLGRHRDRQVEKGTDILERAAKEVVARHPDKANLTIVENRPYSEYLNLLCKAHIVLDQLYSYTPATNALLAMARGLNVVSGAEPEYYNFIGEYDNRPIISADVRYPVLLENIERAVLDYETIYKRGRDGREFVVKHNDCVTVARRAIDFWSKHL